MAVVISEDDQGGGAGPDAGTAFAAGVASATAAQASEDAEAAEQVAEAAEQRADMAQDAAARAEADSWDARTAVDGLRGEFAGALESLRAEVEDRLSAPQTDAGAGEGETEAPPPEEREAPAQPAAEGKPAKSSGYGSRTWFGGRHGS